MNQRADLEAAFLQASKYHAAGQFTEAEQVYQRLLTPGKHRKVVYDALAALYLQTGRPVEAAEMLVRLTEESPDDFSGYVRLAGLLDGLDQTEAAIGHYQRLLQRQPEFADAHFNMALLQKKAKCFSDALDSYGAALRFGIEGQQEVYSNMGVLYSDLRQPEKAREMFERAQEISPNYIPSLFNLAGLFEEQGESDQASDVYQRILTISPDHWDSLARLAYLRKVGDADDDIIERLATATGNSAADSLGQEGLYFALGKVLDDVERYDDAFAAYRSANELGRRRNPQYDRAAAEQGFAQIIDLFDKHWIEGAASDLTATPIFICGMFRSGSTLVEQILGAHPSITAGGEFDILPWLMARQLAPFPNGVVNAAGDKLRRVAAEYLARTQELFPQSEAITDKRPDNFLHIGLIKALFPAAKIIHTKRNPWDTCLSVYFQQLGGGLSYATDIENIAHYRSQHDRLMDHWTNSCGLDIFCVDYDELVVDPETVLRGVIDYLDVSWDDSLLDFSAAKNLVKTASVWQVRGELHAKSSGRWRNYEAYLQGLPSIFPRPDVHDTDNRT